MEIILLKIISDVFFFLTTQKCTEYFIKKLIKNIQNKTIF